MTLQQHNAEAAGADRDGPISQQSQQAIWTTRLMTASSSVFARSVLPEILSITAERSSSGAYQPVTVEIFAAASAARPGVRRFGVCLGGKPETPPFSVQALEEVAVPGRRMGTQLQPLHSDHDSRRSRSVMIVTPIGVNLAPEGDPWPLEARLVLHRRGGTLRFIDQVKDMPEARCRLPVVSLRRSRGKERRHEQARLIGVTIAAASSCTAAPFS